MADAGGRFETEVRQAMREAGIDSIADLERKTGIKRRTWEDWFGGLHQPRPNSLALAARPLKRTPQQLLARWEGRPARGRRTPPADPVEVASSAVVAAIDRQTEMLRQMLERMAPLPSRPTGDEERAAAEAEAERDRRAAGTPRPAGHQNDGVE